MIELAAATWKLEITLAVQKLREAGVPLPETLATPTGVQDYLRWHVRLRKRLRRFWTNAQAAAAGQPALLRELLRGLDVPLASSDWPARGGQFVGLVARADLDQYILGTVTGSSAKNPRRYYSFGLSPAAFAGEGWNHALLVPYSDLPGRICGFLGIGRNVRRKPEYAFFPAASFNGANHREAGLAMLDNTLHVTHPAIVRTLFVFTDPLAAIRVQLRHLRESTAPLPLVASFRGPMAHTRNVWRNIRRDRVICWSPGGDLEAVGQAKFADALVSPLGHSDEQLQRRLSEMTAVEYLNRVERHAIPWAASLRERLQSMNRTESEATLLRVDFSNAEFDEFLRECDPLLLARLRETRSHVGVIRQVRYNERVVCETKGVWQLRTGEAISNAILRINQVITSRRNRTYYRGVILFKDREYPFLERAETLETQGFQWMYNYLRDFAGAGIMEHTHAWNRRAVALAVRFHPPDQLEGVEHIGWDQARGCFQFHDFAIAAGGAVDATIGCLFDTDVPTKGLPQPEGSLPASAIRRLGESHDEAGVVWAVAAAVAANLLTTPGNQPWRGILLDGDGASTVGAAAAVLLGCSEVQVSDRPERTPPTSPHAWPLVVTHRDGKELSPRHWLGIPQASKYVLTIPSLACQTAGLRQAWHIVRCGRRLGSLQLTADSVPLLIPYYLADLCRRALRRNSQTISTAGAVLDDMLTWFTELGGATGGLERAREFLEPAGTPPCRYFVRLVAHALGQGALITSYNHSNPAADICYEEEGPGLVWISQAAISDAASELGGLPLDVLLVTKLLQDAGVLEAETRRQGRLGWQLPRKWWDTQWRTLVAKGI